MAENIIGLRQFKKDLEQFPKAIMKRFIDRFGDVIIEAVITAAKAGIGPGDQKYPAYSESYRKQLGLGTAKKPRATSARLAKAQPSTGGRKNFLSLSGTMLDKDNFTWKLEGTDAVLIRSGPNEQVDIYAQVHNDGLPIGKGGPVKQREFMHFEARITQAVINKSIDKVAADLTRQFNEGKTPR